ncbi:hypothetical protein RIF29_18784 [Crotalaria pallida]|uniref:NHL repeat-containing protein n=1 Tax=Crotalaria pallida TaxID=3830 RepID=A0AAN9EYC8_CROPI
MGRSCFVLFLALVILLSLFSTSSATPPAKIVTGVVSNVVSSLLKRLWSLKSPAKPVHHTRSMMKFESGYNVDTIFDGSKLGIEPHSIEISPNGEHLVLDSENSNIYEISSPMTRYSRPKLLAGSPEGYIGHIDGRPREARMNHPKGLTVDDKGNIYIADTMNMAIRKISDEGVTTIAGGKWGQVGGHVDGPGEDAKFSNDFDVVYVASSCSLLVVDRGNQAIREIHLHQDDCSTYDEYDSSFPLGIAVILAAAFFGYMLALLHWRVRALFSSPDDPRAPPSRKGAPHAAQQRPTKSVRPPLIPNEDEYEYEKPDEGFFVSLGRLFVNSGSSMAEILGGLFSGGSKRKPLQYHQYHHQQQYHHQFSNRHHPNALPMQESFVIPDEDEPPPPPLETRTPTSRNGYPFMSNELEKPQQFKRTRAYLDGWGGDYTEQQQQQQQQRQLQQQQQQQHPKVQHQHQQRQQQLQTRYSSTPQSYYEESCETNEIVFGAVQEHDGRREAMVIKAVDYGDPKFSHHNIRPRLNYVGYSQGHINRMESKIVTKGRGDTAWVQYSPRWSFNIQFEQMDEECSGASGLLDIISSSCDVIPFAIQVALIKLSVYLVDLDFNFSKIQHVK